VVVVSQILLKGGEVSNFNILKSDDLVIGGYASIEMVDKQNDLITLEALNEAVEKFMEGKKYRNVMSNHSNVQVGEVIDNYRDKNGVLHKTKVDDVGFYVVIKLRDDIEKAKEISRGIRKGTLRSFSIGGQEIQMSTANITKLID
jgi:phage head maturation protease